MGDQTRTVFLSYASEDTAAAERICAALRASGIVVWFDKNALRGGDAWDAAIRKQIKSCALFIPVISSNSHARGEGYFRLEWKLAIDRSHLMSPDQPFLLPVVIDDVGDDDRVPERFRDVQWSRLPAGAADAAFLERVASLLQGTLSPKDGATRPVARPSMVPLAVPGANPQRSVPAPSTDARSALWARPRAWLLLAVIAIGIGLSAWVAHQVLPHRSKIAPYSLEDRRMTFAILPLKAPDGDAFGARVAKAMTDGTYEYVESSSLWAHAVSGEPVDQALARYASARELAAALNVHFLLRGSVSRADGGYAVAMVVVDGESERVLATTHIAIPAEQLKPKWKEDMDRAVWLLVRAALEVEVKRARERPLEELDVRDLAFRAFIDWRLSHRGPDAKGAYLTATELLNRALKLAPDDPLALYLTADINLCDCVEAWSTNVAEQQAIGEAAMEKYLRIDPSASEMNLAKAGLYQMHGRYEEALALADAVLAREGDDSDAILSKADALLHLGRVQEALTLADSVHARYPDETVATAIAAHIHYATGDYAASAALARTAATQMSSTLLKNRIYGTILLTRAAAEAA
jgi:tetratricopeptide (TPR) repeat protein